MRTCQVQGVQATAQMQAIARRVADENRQLRQLLEEVGVPSDAVENRIALGRRSPDVDSPMSQLGGMLGHNFEDASRPSRLSSMSSDVSSGISSGNSNGFGHGLGNGASHDLDEGLGSGFKSGFTNGMSNNDLNDGISIDRIHETPKRRRNGHSNEQGNGLSNDLRNDLSTGLNNGLSNILSNGASLTLANRLHNSMQDDISPASTRKSSTYESPISSMSMPPTTLDPRTSTLHTRTSTLDSDMNPTNSYRLTPFSMPSPSNVAAAAAASSSSSMLTPRSLTGRTTLSEPYPLHPSLVIPGSSMSANPSTGSGMNGMVNHSPRQERTFSCDTAATMIEQISPGMGRHIVARELGCPLGRCVGPHEVSQVWRLVDRCTTLRAWGDSNSDLTDGISI